MMARGKKKDQNTPPQDQDLGETTKTRMAPDSKLQRPPLHSSPNSTKLSSKEKSSHSDESNISSETASDDSFSNTNSPRQRVYTIQSDPSIDPQSDPNSSLNKSRAKESPSLKKDHPRKLDDEQQHEAQRGNSSTFMVILKIGLGLLLVIFIIRYFLKSEPPKEENVTTKIIDRLEKDFANQPKSNMKIIKKSLGNVINTDVEPESPAIILFVSSKGAEKTTDCLVRRLANEVLIETHGSSFDDVHAVDVRSFKKMDPDETKKEIDDQLEKGFSPERLNVFLVKYIDEIPGEAALIMQKYCDHENAQYKKAVVMMTISAEDEIPKNVTHKEINAIARGRLNRTWVDLKSDQFSPLYTRISGFISPVLREPNLSKC